MPSRWTAYGEQIVFHGAWIALHIDRSQNEIQMQLLVPSPAGGVSVRINHTTTMLTEVDQVFSRPFAPQENGHRFPVVLFEQRGKRQGNQANELSFDHQQKFAL